MNDIAQPEINPYQPPLADYGLSPYGAADLDQQWPADRGSRFAGALVDSLLGMATLIPGGILAALLENDLQPFGYALMALCFLAFEIYQMVLISTTGQTLAKRWLKMRIVKMDGSPVGFGAGVALRSWVPGVIGALPYLGGIFSLVDALFIFGQESRCLHDLIAGTKVIKVVPTVE